MERITGGHEPPSIYARPVCTPLSDGYNEETHNSPIRDCLGRGQRMGRGGALWNERAFLEVNVCAWGSLEDVGEDSYVGNGDRYARRMVTNQKLNVLRIG